MDSWFFNKIAGAVLSAVLVAFGAGTLAEILHPHKAVKPGYVLPVKEVTTTVAAAPAPFKFDAVAALLKSGSAEDGRAAFAPCRSCHTADKGGKPGQGPNLWGVVGRNIASNADFPRYSAALKDQKGNWSFEKLASFLHDPRTAVPGTQMTFNVKDNVDIANLLLFLRAQSDSPVPLPN